MIKAKTVNNSKKNEKLQEKVAVRYQPKHRTVEVLMGHRKIQPA